MDNRISRLLSLGVDKITPDRYFPALVIILEEYPGLIAAVKTMDAALKPADRLLPRLKSAVQRLIQEGAKAGLRVILVAQRMDAEIIGGSERSNIGNRISLRVDNADAVRMLHPNASPETIEQINGFAAGYAYLERPAEPGQVVRFDYLDYQGYRSHVIANAGGGDVANEMPLLPPIPAGA